MSTILLKQKDYEELSQSIFDLNLKVMEKDKKIERLHSIIKEVREYIEENMSYNTGVEIQYIPSGEELLEILDKVD